MSEAALPPAPAGLSKALIGRASAPLVHDVEKGHIRRFAEAIGDDDPVYRDEAAARAAGLPGIVAPPTFAIALRPNDVRAGLDIDWRKLLHAEQELEQRRPLVAGDRITVVQRIADVYDKSGRSGWMDFLVLETEGKDESGELVFVARATVAIRR